MLPDWLTETLIRAPRHWLVTGGAGFIGSHLTDSLLDLGQRVTVLDNLATGARRNLAGASARPGFRLIEGDIREPAECARACEGVQIVLHHAAQVSVPESIERPDLALGINRDGFRNILAASAQAGVERLVYASSSAVYGDATSVPAIEDMLGKPLSPYAETKRQNELDAGASDIGRTVGLRYFNVFGSRQDPAGGYAAVIPAWIAACLSGRDVTINGDGETTRDFCHVSNVVRANLLAALAPGTDTHAILNIGCGGQISLNRLFDEIRASLARARHPVASVARHGPFRKGDVRYSQAEIARARAEIGYEPVTGLGAGLTETIPWFVELTARTQRADCETET